MVIEEKLDSQEKILDRIKENIMDTFVGYQN